MKRILRHSCILALLFAAGLRAQTPAPPRMVEVPLLDCSGLPCIEMAAANGKTLRLLIDMGEVNSYLDTKAAHTLGLELQPLKGGDRASIAEVQQTVVPGAKIGDLAMGDFPFMVLDTTEQPEKPGQRMPALPADGALTYSAFRNRLLQIDYPHHVVRISEPQDTAMPCPNACGDLLIKHFGNYGPVTLTASGFTVNGQAVGAQIDTMFSGSILVYPPAAEKLGLKRESKSKQKHLFPYTQGGVKLAEFEGATASFHDEVVWKHVPLFFFTKDDTPPTVAFDVTVGNGLMSDALVTFDFKGMHLRVERATNSANPQLTQ